MKQIKCPQSLVLARQARRAQHAYTLILSPSWALCSLRSATVGGISVVESTAAAITDVSLCQQPWGWQKSKASAWIFSSASARAESGEKRQPSAVRKENRGSRVSNTMNHIWSCHLWKLTPLAAWNTFQRTIPWQCSFIHIDTIIYFLNN